MHAVDQAHLRAFYRTELILEAREIRTIER
jgi:hypothetical protein